METLDDVHISRLKFDKDSHLNSNVVMIHVLTSEIGMVASRLLGFDEFPDGLYVRVR